jgi:hypothetical protein
LKTGIKSTKPVEISVSDNEIGKSEGFSEMEGHFISRLKDIF